MSSPSRRLVGRTRKQVMLMYKQRQVALSNDVAIDLIALQFTSNCVVIHLQLRGDSPLIVLCCGQDARLPHGMGKNGGLVQLRSADPGFEPTWEEGPIGSPLPMDDEGRILPQWPSVGPEFTPVRLSQTAHPAPVDPLVSAWRVERRGEFSPLGPGAGCFLALGSGLWLVGTASTRR